MILLAHFLIYPTTTSGSLSLSLPLFSLSCLFHSLSTFSFINAFSLSLTHTLQKIHHFFLRLPFSSLLFIRNLKTHKKTFHLIPLFSARVLVFRQCWASAAAFDTVWFLHKLKMAMKIGKSVFVVLFAVLLLSGGACAVSAPTSPASKCRHTHIVCICVDLHLFDLVLNFSSFSILARNR